jgi:hypothetical protein
MPRDNWGDMLARNEVRKPAWFPRLSEASVSLKELEFQRKMEFESSTLERLEQFAKVSRRGMENYVGASARNVGVGWDRARKLVWVREWRRESFELPYYYT